MTDGVPQYAVIGCLTLDSVVTATRELIPRTCGGNALYASVGVHVWDRSVGLVTRAGNDLPAACLAAIEACVDGAGIQRLAAAHPLHVAFAYEPDGSRTRRIPSEILATIPVEWRPYFYDDTHDDGIYLAATPTVDEIPADWLRDVGAVHLPALLVQSHRQLLGGLRAALPGRLVTVDSPWYDRHEPTSRADADLLQMIDVVLPSEEDLARFDPGVSVIASARGLVELGARAVVVKLGAHGSLVVDDDGDVTHVPAYPASAVDPTGAGDSFCGGFLVGLQETGYLVRAALYGTIAASFVVEERSAIPVFRVDRRQAEARIAAIEHLVRRHVSDDPRVAAR